MALSWEAFVLPARGVQAVLSIAVLGLMGYVAQWWSTHWRVMAPVEVNFAIFSSIWTLLSVMALIVVPWKMAHVATSTAGKFSLFALEVLTALYWFGGFVALAVFLSDRVCFGAVCDVAKAGTVLSAVSWVCWMGTVGASAIKVFGGGMGGKKAGAKERKVEMHQGV